MGNYLTGAEQHQGHDGDDDDGAPPPPPPPPPLPPPPLMIPPIVSVAALFGRAASPSPSHPAAAGPRAPTRYRVLPRGAQGLWTFRRAVEATLQRRGYDGQLWAALESGYEPVVRAAAGGGAGQEQQGQEEDGIGSTSSAGGKAQGGNLRGSGAMAAGASEAVTGSGSTMSSSSSSSSTTTTTTTTNGLKRRSPVGKGGDTRERQQQAQQRRPPLPSQLLPAILRWADVGKEVTLLKMEDVQVANGDHVYLRYAVPEALHGYRVVGALVVVQAHDQGWSSFPHEHRTTQGSCTWADLIVEAAQTETTRSRPNVAAATELYRNLHAEKRWQTHVLRLEAAEAEGKEKEMEMDAGRVTIGREEQATPPSSPGGHQQHHQQEGEAAEGEEEEEAKKRQRERAAVVKALGQPGATLSLQLSARYPGWVHYCRHASVTVRFMRDE